MPELAHAVRQSASRHQLAPPRAAALAAVRAAARGDVREAAALIAEVERGGPLSEALDRILAQVARATLLASEGLLYALARHPSRVLGKEALADAAWGSPYAPLCHDDPLKSNMLHLRRLLAGSGVTIACGDPGYRLDASERFVGGGVRSARARINAICGLAFRRPMTIDSASGDGYRKLGIALALAAAAWLAIWTGPCGGSAAPATSVPRGEQTRGVAMMEPSEPAAPR